MTLKVVKFIRPKLSEQWYIQMSYLLLQTAVSVCAEVLVSPDASSPQSLVLCSWSETKKCHNSEHCTRNGTDPRGRSKEVGLRFGSFRHEEDIEMTGVFRMNQSVLCLTWRLSHIPNQSYHWRRLNIHKLHIGHITQPNLTKKMSRTSAPSLDADKVSLGTVVKTGKIVWGGGGREGGMDAQTNKQVNHSVTLIIMYTKHSLQGGITKC